MDSPVGRGWGRAGHLTWPGRKGLQDRQARPMGGAQLPETPPLWTSLPRSSPLPPCCPSPRSWPHPSSFSFPLLPEQPRPAATQNPWMQFYQVASGLPGAHGRQSTPHPPAHLSVPALLAQSPPPSLQPLHRLRKASPLFPDPTSPSKSVPQGLAAPQVCPPPTQGQPLPGLSTRTSTGLVSSATAELHQDLGAHQQEDEGQGTRGWLLCHVWPRRPPQEAREGQAGTRPSASCCQGRPQRTDTSGHKPSKRPRFPDLLQPEPSSVMKTVDAGHRPHCSQGPLASSTSVQMPSETIGSAHGKPSQDGVGTVSSALNGLGRPTEAEMGGSDQC